MPPEVVMIYTLIAVKWVVSYQTECFYLNQGALKKKDSCPNTVARPRTRQVHDDLRTGSHERKALASSPPQ